MSKNLTLKGAAFGALVALASSAFAGAPASAAGLADTSFVSLAPTTGTAYATIAEADATFSLTANEATSVTGSGRKLKFLVADADAAVEPVQSSTLATATLAASGGSWARANDVVTVTAVAHGLADGSRIYLTATNLPHATDAVAAGYYTITVTGADTFTFASNVDSSDDVTGGKFNNATTSADTTIKITRGARATDNSYVVNSGANTDSSNEVLNLSVAGTTTRSVGVTAWVDANSNGEIDSTEYVSPTRTVTFKKYSEVVPSLTWTPVLVGDENVVVKVSTEPKLNWEQLTASNIAVDFQRQGSSATLAGGTESWSDTTGLWTITRALKETNRASVAWTALKTPAVTPFTASSTPQITHFAQSGATATFTTDAAHNLSVNDRITVTSFLASASQAKVTAVTEYTFSYTTTASEATTAKTAIGSNTPSVALNSFGYATAGTYTAAVKIGSTPTKIGSTFASDSTSATAASVSNKATATSDVNSGFKVRKSYTGSVVVTSTVKNSDGVAVGAGVPVSIAVTENSAGTVVVNGETVSTSKTISATTNADGKVVITTSNSSGAVGDEVSLAVTSQGFSDTDTLAWEAAQYTLADTLDPATDVDTNDARVVKKGGVLKFELAVVDQFLSPLTSAARVKVTLAGSRWDSVSYETLNAGKASVAITDAAVDITDSTPTVAFLVQTKDTAGSWVEADSNSDVVSDFARSSADLDNETLDVKVIGTYGSKVVLNADTIGSADLSAPVATTAAAASDLRILGQSAASFTSQDDVNITGTVVDALTEVAVDGHAVTVSGPSNVLFRVGNVSAFGSLTFIAGSNTAFNISAWSNAAQTNSVITVTADGASSTVKVSFTGVSTDLKKLSITPLKSTYVAGQTVVYNVLLTDTNGNPVNTVAKADTPAAAYITVSYSGPGVISGPLPVETDEDGKATVRIVTGLADVEDAVLTVKYDQNHDGDYVDTNDLTVVSTVKVAAPVVVPPVVVPEASSKIGTANGRIYANVKDGKGATVTVKIGNKYYTKTALNNDYTFSFKAVVGAKTAVKVYVDGDLSSAKTITVK